MTRGERAQLAWQVLLGAAHNRQILTYTLLGDLIGMGPGTLAPVLGLIMKYCHSQGLPPLTVLVVNKDTGLPGSGLRTLEDLARDREDVFSEDWYGQLPPTAEALEAAGRLEIPGSSGTPNETVSVATAIPATDASQLPALVAQLSLVDQLTGRQLNDLWKVGARHALYHHEGRWYHQLRDFPGAFFDYNGYVLFETREDYLRAPQLRITQDVYVPDSISSMSTYVRVR
jgi:hypothetical protein